MRLLIGILVLLAIPVYSSELALNERNSLGKIIVEVIGLGNNKGKVRCFLYDSAEKIGIKDESIYIVVTDIFNNKTQAVFDSISFGTYAVCFYHDENNNDKIDKRFTGWPKETIGFSNEGKISLKGVPQWDKISFKHKSTATEIQIKIK